MFYARLRFASFWIAQVSRVLADWCLRMAAFLALLGAGDGYGWHLTTALFVGPFILLAPLNGILTNALPRRGILAGTAAFTLLVVALFAGLHWPWHYCLAIVALGSAVYGAARYAVLPAAAIDTGVPLPRLNGWVEAGGAAAIVSGVFAGAGIPTGLLSIVLIGLNALCLVASVPAAFPSDLIRPERPAAAVLDFFRDCRRVFQDREARASLFGLSSFQAVVTAGTGIMLAALLGGEQSGPGIILTPVLLLGAGAVAGSAVAALEGHPRRCLGLVAPGATGVLFALAWAGLSGGVSAVPALLLGFSGGLVNVPLRSVYLGANPADARGNATSIMNSAIYVATTGVALILIALIALGMPAAPGVQFVVPGLLCLTGTFVAWYYLYGHALEVAVEIGLLPFYRIRAHGPGAGRLPARGPLLIISNHAAYLDPFWIAKVVPRQIRPMMTSAFYDLPYVRWLSNHVARAIRVPTGVFRREAPELQEAIAALRNGECVVVFPEGMLRRSEEVYLRPFGRGVWHILHDLPDTPVSLCWIEGSWGSYFSYKDGPPGKHKPRDRARRIDLAFTDPRPIDAAILANHHATRAWLRHGVIACRTFLGLPDVDPGRLPVEVPEEPAPGSPPA